MTEIPQNNFQVTWPELLACLGVSAMGTNPHADAMLRGVTTASNRVIPGNIFVAIRGERTDGHRYIDDAISRGASCIITHTHMDASVPVCVVPDTLEALGTLGALARKRYKGRVYAVTGSVGKTSVKELLAHMLVGLGYCTLKTEGNLNNLIGAPMMLLCLRDQDRVVFELGMSVPGEMEKLSRMTHPHVSAINNIALVHTEGVGDLAGVAKEKAQIWSHTSVAVVHPYGERTLESYLHACAHLKQCWHGDAQLLVGGGQELPQGNGVLLTGMELHSDASITATYGVSGQTIQARVPNASKGLMRSLGCALALLHVGENLSVADLEKAIQSLETFRPAPGRYEVHEMRDGITLIDDTYNASPASMMVAIESAASLAKQQGKTLMLCLGAMKELGTYEEAKHVEVTRAAKVAAKVWFVGEAYRNAAEREWDERATWLGDVQDWVKSMKTNCIPPNTVILFKGSRSMRIEKAFEHLQGILK